MSNNNKNKQKGGQQKPAKTEQPTKPVVEKKDPVKAPANNAGKKEEKKQPIDPAIIDTTAEVVETPVKSKTPVVDYAELLKATSAKDKDGNLMSMDGIGNAYAALHDRFGKRNDDAANAVNVMLDASGPMLAVHMSLHLAIRTGSMNMNVPTKDVDTVLAAFEAYGATGLKALPTADPNQGVIPFATAENLSKEAAAAIKNEAKIHSKPAPELDWAKWGNDEEVKTGLSYILTSSKEEIAVKFAKALEAKDNYFKSLAIVAVEKSDKDEAAKKTEIEAIEKSFAEESVGQKIESLLQFVGTTGVGIISGIAGTMVTNANLGQNPFIPHAVVKRNWKLEDDKKIAGVVRGLIMAKLKFEKVEKPEEHNAWLGLSNCNVMDILGYATCLLDEDKRYTKQFEKEYINELCTKRDDKNNPIKDDGYTLRLINKMIEVNNLYREENNQLSLVPQKDLPSLLEPIVKSREEKLAELRGSKKETPTT